MADEDPPAEDEHELLTTPEVAEILRVHPMTVAKWRYGHGDVELPFVKFGRSVRYRKEDVYAFLEQNKRLWSF